MLRLGFVMNVMDMEREFASMGGKLHICIAFIMRHINMIANLHIRDAKFCVIGVLMSQGRGN